MPIIIITDDSALLIIANVSNRVRYYPSNSSEEEIGEIRWYRVTIRPLQIAEGFFFIYRKYRVTLKREKAD